MEMNDIRSFISFIKSPSLFYSLIAINVVIILLLVLLHRKNLKWIKWIAIPSLIIGLLFIVIQMSAKAIIITIVKENAKALIGVVNPVIDLIVNNLFKYGMILVSMSIVLFIILIVVRIIEKNKSKKDLTI